MQCLLDSVKDCISGISVKSLRLRIRGCLSRNICCNNCCVMTSGNNIKQEAINLFDANDNIPVESSRNISSVGNLNATNATSGPRTTEASSRSSVYKTLQDLPGIGKSYEKYLNNAGITTVKQMYQLLEDVNRDENLFVERMAKMHITNKGWASECYKGLMETI